MKLLPRLLFIILIVCIAVSWFPKTHFWEKTKKTLLTKKEVALKPKTVTNAKLKTKAAEARNYLTGKNYNNQTCFFIDMSLPSGQKRFFIFDLKRDSLLSAGLVTHGNCMEYWLEEKRYSNVVGSGCTSLGKYKTGNPYTGKFGYSYKLYGLDSSNSNAYARAIVLHSHECVPDDEVTDEICQSNGCPTVAPVFLQQLKKIINSSKKPVLLWIYE
ncbi:MAG: murein L,D-transpeptidase catalytic domain family protein [Chitinophagaceae bacterium]|nr:murein L,D-transpeptidase catalytic domain family protein [Chitinophagaceae bacterium]MBK8953099.1 murein L,D-transpeptidase catalytic domain family protein [Chitinophagaceae bacterium]